MSLKPVRKASDENIRINKDFLNSPDAIFQAFEEGQHLISPNVAEFIKTAKYEEVEEGFNVIIATPGMLGLGYGQYSKFSEVFKFAEKFGFGLLTDQQVYRFRHVYTSDIPGQLYFPATAPVIYKNEPYLYLLERFVVDGKSSLSDVPAETTKVFPGTQIIFLFPSGLNL
jgi:hypothetical protein